MLRHPAAGELKMLSFWAGGISSFPPCAREYRLLRRLYIQFFGAPLGRSLLKKSLHQAFTVLSFQGLWDVLLQSLYIYITWRTVRKLCGSASIQGIYT